MQKHKVYYFLAGLLMTVWSFESSSQVLIQLFQPPPNQWRVEHLWNLTLTNTGNTALSVYLMATVEEATEGLVFEGTSAVFSLAANFSGRINPRLLEPADVGYVNDELEAIVFRTGTMPEGIYTICISVILAGDDTELGRNCIIQPITHYSPPELIAPFDMSGVHEVLPVFIWTPPMPLNPDLRVRYSIRIVELLGEQEAVEAIEANRAFFVQQNIMTTSLQYPIAARSFREGQGYAWQITAFGGPGNVELGKSPVWRFNFSAHDHTETDDWVASCKPFGIKLTRKLQGDTLFHQLAISYNDTIEPQNPEPYRFAVEITGNALAAFETKADREWMHRPARIEEPVSRLSWRHTKGEIPGGKHALGLLYFQTASLNNTRIVYTWFDRDDNVLCRDTLKPGEADIRQYYVLNENWSENYVVIRDSLLNLQYANHNPSLAMRTYVIIDFDEQKTVQSIKSDELFEPGLTGLNRFQINLHDYRLLPGKIYLLAVSDMMTHYYLKFKIHATNEK